MPLSKRLGAECLGTFWLVFGGRGSAVLASAFPKVGAQLWLFWLMPILGAALAGVVVRW